MKKPPLSDDVATLQQIMDQDLEPDPGGGGKKIREGVAADRRVSVEDSEMRHGRKSKTKRFNGFKRHIATDLDSGLVLSGAIPGEPTRGRGGTCSGRRHREAGARDRHARDLTITCPAGEEERIEFGSVTEFDPEACDHC